MISRLESNRNPARKPEIRPFFFSGFRRQNVSCRPGVAGVGPFGSGDICGFHRPRWGTTLATCLVPKCMGSILDSEFISSNEPLCGLHPPSRSSVRSGLFAQNYCTYAIHECKVYRGTMVKGSRQLKAAMISAVVLNGGGFAGRGYVSQPELEWGTKCVWELRCSLSLLSCSGMCMHFTRFGPPGPLPFTSLIPGPDDT
jgi:hypothetical protein